MPVQAVVLMVAGGTADNGTGQGGCWWRWWTKVLQQYISGLQDGTRSVEEDQQLLAGVLVRYWR